MTTDLGSVHVGARPQERGLLVRLERVTRRYGAGVPALDAVDLAIAPGEAVAIVGRSGSGKSTLLNILGLLDAPDAGTIWIDGRPLTRTDDDARSSWRSAALGFVFQRSHLLGRLTVRENVELGLRYSAGTGAPSRAQVRRSVDRALADVSLTHRADARASTLSGGEMQRVAIARTLVRSARLWLADEPTGNLDTAQSAEIIDLLRTRARAQGAALVVVTHEPEIAARMDRVVTLSDGRVVGDTGTITPVDALPELRPVSTAARSPWRRVARTVRFVTQGVRSQPGRSVAGVVASALAVGLTVAALGLSQSAAAQVTSLFDARRASQVTATFVDDGADAVRPLRVSSVRDVAGVTDVEAWEQWTQVPLESGGSASTLAEVDAVDPAPGRATDSVVAWAGGGDQVLDPGEVVLGHALAARLGVTQTDVSPEITLQGRRLRVTGILTSSRVGTAAGAAFVAPGSVPGLPPSLTTVLHARTQPGAARQLADQVALIADPFAERTATVDPVLDADAYRGRLESSVSVALTVLAVVASLAGFAGVVMVNVLAVTSRVPELGLRRALGSRRNELVALVVGECTVLGALGAAAGLALGFTAVMVATAVARWQPVFDPRLLLVPLAAAVVFGAGAGLLPAVVAARVQPADAVRA